MKVTVDINSALLADAKALAAQQRISLKRLVEEGPRLRLRSTRPMGKPARRKLPVFEGRGGLVAGVNPLGNKAMFDAVDDNA